MLLTLLIATVAKSQSEDKPVSKRYDVFQGEWHLISLEGPEIKRTDLPEINVKVTGRQVELTGSGVDAKLLKKFELRVPDSMEDNPYRELRRHGAETLSDIVDVENQIWVFWFVGIYKVKNDRLELALKYCGQGLEGVHFKNFRPPSSFDQKPTDGETRIVLERKKK